MCDLDYLHNDLPPIIQAQIYELEIELAEGDITAQGFEKKTKKIIENYLKSEEIGGITNRKGYSSYIPPQLQFPASKTSNTEFREVIEGKGVKSPINVNSSTEILKNIMLKLIKSSISPPNLPSNSPMTYAGAVETGFVSVTDSSDSDASNSSNLSRISQQGAKKHEFLSGNRAKFHSSSENADKNVGERHFYRDITSGVEENMARKVIPCALRMISQSPEKLKDATPLKTNDSIGNKKKEYSPFSTKSNDVSIKNKLNSSELSQETHYFTKNRTNSGERSQESPGIPQNNDVFFGKCRATDNITNSPKNGNKNIALVSRNRKKVNSGTLLISTDDETNLIEISSAAVNRKNALLKRITRNESRHNSSNNRHKAVRMALQKSFSPQHIFENDISNNNLQSTGKVDGGHFKKSSSFGDSDEDSPKSRKNKYLLLLKQKHQLPLVKRYSKKLSSNKSPLLKTASSNHDVNETDDLIDDVFEICKHGDLPFPGTDNDDLAIMTTNQEFNNSSSYLSTTSTTTTTINSNNNNYPTHNVVEKEGHLNNDATQMSYDDKRRHYADTREKNKSIEENYRNDNVIVDHVYFGDEEDHDLNTSHIQSSMSPAKIINNHIKTTEKCNRFPRLFPQTSPYYTALMPIPQISQSQGKIPDIDDQNVAVSNTKISDKIQSLLHALQESKEKSYADYFKDDEDDDLIQSVGKQGNLDIPKPEGPVMKPLVGPPLLNNSNFSKSIEAALYKHANNVNLAKSPAFMVLDLKGKSYDVLTYGKLFKKASKLAYNLLNKVYYNRTSENRLKPGDRIALVFPNTEPLSFTIAFYACLLAGLIPVPVDVPIYKKDALFRHIGFLLSSVGSNVALTCETCFKALPKIFSATHNNNGIRENHHLQYNFETNASIVMYESMNVSSNSAQIPVIFDHLPNGGLEIRTSRSWPVLTWFSINKLNLKLPTKDWQPPALNPLYNNPYASSNLEQQQLEGPLDANYLPRQINDDKSTPTFTDDSLQYRFDPLNISGHDNLAYIEGISNVDGSVKGVMITKSGLVSHCKALATTCNYNEGQTMVCVQDFKRDVGLWHGILTSIYTGMNVIFVPYSLMKMNPAIWINMITKFHAESAIVKSRDLHWGLLAHRTHQHSKGMNLNVLNNLLISDANNPWSLSSCEAFYNVFRHKGLKRDAIKTCAWSPETQTISIQRTFPSISDPTASSKSNEINSTAIKIDISMSHLTHNVVNAKTRNPPYSNTDIDLNHPKTQRKNVIQSNPLTTLTLQNVGKILPASVVVTIELEGTTVASSAANLCRTDEIGEICLASRSTAQGYWGLSGLSTTFFKVNPRDQDNLAVNDMFFVRSGLYGFINSDGEIFIVGNRNGRITVGKRRHSVDDLLATVLAVSPLKFIHRGRLALFSVNVFRDERIVLVAEQRPDCTEEDSFIWMSRVLQAVQTIHQVGIYCIALLAPNHLPKSPFGGVMVSEVKKRFKDGCLHPINILMCPHTCVLNLSKPRLRPPEVSPGSQYVGNMVKGKRFAIAHGLKNENFCSDFQQIPSLPSTHLKVGTRDAIIENLVWRANNTPENVALTILSSKAALTSTLTFAQLHKKVEKLAFLLSEKSKIIPGDHLALIYLPGFDFVISFLACLSLDIIPIPIRPPTPLNVTQTITTVRLICDVSRVKACLTTTYIQKLLHSKEAEAVIDSKSWPKLIVTDENSSKRKCGWNARTFLDQYYLAVRGGHQVTTNKNLINSPNGIAYIDFSVTSNGTLIGVKVNHETLSNLCKSQKIACELYPSRVVSVCLDPYSGLGLVLWSLSSVYSGHHTILIPPYELETYPGLWLSAITQFKIRDTYCSYNVLEGNTNYYAQSNHMEKLVSSGVDLSCLRNCVVVGEERPRIELIRSFTKIFGNSETLKFNPRCLTTSFGCPVNFGICLQGASSPDLSILYVDKRSLRNDRLNLVEKGSPHCLPLMQCGKILPGVTIAIANPFTNCLCADTHLGEIWVSSSHNSNSYYVVYGSYKKALPTSSNSHNFNYLKNTTTQSDEETCSFSNNELYPQGYLTNSDFACRLSVGLDTKTIFARTGYLGFIRRTYLSHSQEYQDSLYVVGSLEESFFIRGMRFHPIDIEQTIIRGHKRACQCAVFTWPEKPNLLVAVIELTNFHQPTVTSHSKENNNSGLMNNSNKYSMYDREALDLIPATTNAVLEEHHIIIGVIVVLDKPGLIPINSRGQKQRFQLRDMFLQDKLDPVYVAYNM